MLLLNDVTISGNLREIFQNAQRVLVLTGAGVSAESGVPTFRGGGDATVWKGMPFDVISSAQMVNEIYRPFGNGSIIAGNCSVCLSRMPRILNSQIGSPDFATST